MLNSNRKTKIFIFNVITAVICVYLIKDNSKYNDFLNFTLYLSIAFFASNTLGKFNPKFDYKNRKDNEEEPY